jgi:hypothetical protein
MEVTTEDKNTIENPPTEILNKDLSPTIADNPIEEEAS